MQINKTNQEKTPKKKVRNKTDEPVGYNKAQKKTQKQKKNKK